MSSNKLGAQANVKLAAVVSLPHSMADFVEQLKNKTAGEIGDSYATSDDTQEDVRMATAKKRGASGPILDAPSSKTARETPNATTQETGISQPPEPLNIQYIANIMYNIKTKSDLLEDPVRGLQAVAAWFAKYCPDVSKWHLVFSKEERRTLPKKWSKVVDLYFPQGRKSVEAEMWRDRQEKPKKKGSTRSELFGRMAEVLGRPFSTNQFSQVGSAFLIKLAESKDPGSLQNLNPTIWNGGLQFMKTNWKMWAQRISLESSLHSMYPHALKGETMTDASPLYRSLYHDYKRYLDSNAATRKRWNLPPLADADLQFDLSDDEYLSNGITMSSEPIVNLMVSHSMSVSQANLTPTHGSILDAALYNAIQTPKRDSQSMSASQVKPNQTKDSTLNAAKVNSMEQSQRASQSMLSQANPTKDSTLDAAKDNSSEPHQRASQSMSISQANPTKGSTLEAAKDISMEPDQRFSQSTLASQSKPTPTHNATLDSAVCNSIQPAQRDREGIVFQIPGWVPLIATEDDKVKWRMEAEEMPLSQLRNAIQGLRDEDVTNRCARDRLQRELCSINDRLTLGDAKLTIFKEVEEANKRHNLGSKLSRIVGPENVDNVIDELMSSCIKYYEGKVSNLNEALASVAEVYSPACVPPSNTSSPQLLHNVACSSGAFVPNFAEIGNNESDDMNENDF